MRKSASLSVRYPGRLIPQITATALVVLCGACASAPAPETFSLTSPASSRPIAPFSRQLLIGEPVAVQPFDGDQIIAVTDGRVSMIGGGQWSDRLPRLVQSRLVQGFEQQGRAVARVGSGLAGDRILGLELRSFQIVNSVNGPEAQVELSARLSDGSTGQIIVARVFKSTFPAEGTQARQAAAALQRALDDVALQITRWSVGNVSRSAPAPRIEPSPATTSTN